MAGPGNILIKVGAETAAAVAELGKVNKAVEATGKSSSSATSMIQKGAVPAAAAFAAVSAMAIKSAAAAAEDARAQTDLEGALRRATDATDAQIASTDSFIDKLAFATGVSDDQLRPALAKLAVATGDVGQAQNALQVALDASVASGKSLDAISGAMAKGFTGNTAALNRLIPGLDQAAIKSGDMTQVMAELARVTGGAAVESANTAAGQYEVFKVRMAELQEAIGAGLLPVMGQLVGIMNKAAQFASQHTTAITALIGVVGVLSGAILVVNAVIKIYQGIQIAVKVATVAWTAAQWLLNAALNANPIGLVVIAIAALAAGLVIAYKHSQTFRDVVAAAFNAVKAAADALGRAFTAVMGAASAAWNWISSHWTAVAFAFGPLGVAIMLIAKNFQTLQGIATGVWGAIKGAIDGVYGAIQSVIGAVGSLISALGRIHVPSISIPHPFSLAAPPVLVGATTRGAGAPVLASAGGTTINVYGAIDPEGTARAVLRVLRGHERRQGR